MTLNSPRQYRSAGVQKPGVRSTAPLEAPLPSAANATPAFPQQLVDVLKRIIAAHRSASPHQRRWRNLHTVGVHAEMAVRSHKNPKGVVIRPKAPWASASPPMRGGHGPTDLHLAVKFRKTESPES